MKIRNIGIDVIKCFAAILITNSHMDILYPNKLFATGGAIGDVLFFFASGFLLFLKPMGRFDNWYKKRINRIYPTVFSWAILSTLFFGKNEDILFTVLHGGGWFVTCIMIYYVLIYFINQHFKDHIIKVWFLSALIIVLWYLFIDKTQYFNMYGETYFKWGHYFLFMLMGAMMGVSDKKLNYHFLSDFIKLIICIVMYYVILAGSKRIGIINQMQIISLLPLLGITFYFYKVANTKPLENIYNSKFWGTGIKIIGGLCLEIYLVQSSLLTDSLNELYPLNLFLIFIVILIMAYLLRCVSRVFAQIFNDQDFNWGSVFRLY